MCNSFKIPCGFVKKRFPFLQGLAINGIMSPEYPMKSATLRLYPEGWATKTQTFYGAAITPTPDYAQLMKAFDAYGERVSDPNEIAPALSRAWAEIQQGRSALLDVILDTEYPR